LNLEENLTSLLERLNKLGPGVQAEIAKQVLRQALTSNYFLYAKYGLGYSEIEWDVHKESIETLESSATRKIVVMPRGTFKSTLGSVAYPMWRLERDPNLTILLDSEIYSNSKTFLREIKGHYQSDRYIQIFGDRVGPKWDESEIILGSRTRNRKEASITCGGVETVKVGQHYDLIIGDDYNSPTNSETPEKCQKVIDHVRYNLNILNPRGEYLLIGTRYAERDVIGFFLSDVLGEKALAEGRLMRSTGVISIEETQENELLGA
jgi:hypothetical protein